MMMMMIMMMMMMMTMMMMMNDDDDDDDAEAHDDNFLCPQIALSDRSAPGRSMRGRAARPSRPAGAVDRNCVAILMQYHHIMGQLVNIPAPPQSRKGNSFKTNVNQPSSP